MTIAVTNLVAGPFVATGAEQILPFEFKVFAADEVEVYQLLGSSRSVVDPADYTVQRNVDVDGSAVEGGSVTVTADAFLGDLYVRAVPSFTQEQVWSDTESRLRNMNEALDRGVLRDLALLEEVGGKLDTPADPAAGYLALNADGDVVSASGTGADAALRTDLGASGGAALVGATQGGSVQSLLDELHLVLARYARDYPPWSGGVYYGDVWPSNVTSYNVAAARMAAGLILVRVFHDNIVDEYVFKDPAGEGSDGGVAAGWQLVSWRGFVNGRVKLWLEQPTEWGARTITGFVIRIVNLALYTYSSGGEGNQGAFRGYGHGGLAIGPTDPQIILSGAGANLQSTANWPVGVRKYGSSLSITCPFRAKFYASATEAVSISANILLDKAQGMSETVTWQALIADVGWNDSYVPMHAVNQGGAATHGKLAGYTAIPLVRDGVQKGNWNTVEPAPVMQFYDESDPTIIAACRVIYGPPMRKNGASIVPAWALNSYGRVHMTDEVDFAKFRVFVASSEQVPPRTAWVMDPADIYSALTRRRTEYLPAGPE